MKRIALFGNPNCGKTTLFNLLTGSRQKVGNWPGVTVERKSGILAVAGEEFEIVDLPGIYSLEQEYLGIDEQIARDYLTREPIDLIINLTDATNLERSLILTQQLLETDIPLIVVVNMLDVAQQQGISIDAGTLAKHLSVPVIPMTASRKSGLQELKAEIEKSQQATANQHDYATRASTPTE